MNGQVRMFLCSDCAYFVRINADPDERLKSCWVNPIARKGHTPSCKEFVLRIEEKEGS